MNVHLFEDSQILERVGIKRAVVNSLPSDFVPLFDKLWQNIEEIL